MDVTLAILKILLSVLLQNIILIFTDVMYTIDLVYLYYLLITTMEMSTIIGQRVIKYRKVILIMTAPNSKVLNVSIPTIIRQHILV